jgi:hypothetical protein
MIDRRASQRLATSLQRRRCRVQIADASSETRHAQGQATGALGTR